MRRSAALLMRPAGGPAPGGTLKFMAPSVVSANVGKLYRSQGSTPIQVVPTSGGGVSYRLERSAQNGAGLCAVCGSYDDTPTGGSTVSGQMYTSSDQFATYVAKNPSLGTNYKLTDLVWFPLLSKFVMVSNKQNLSAAPNFVHTTDGTTFTTINPGLAAGNSITKMIVGPDLLLFLVSNDTGGGSIRFTTNLTTFSNRYNTLGNWVPRKGAYGNGRYVIAGQAGTSDGMAYSVGGATWTAATPPVANAYSIGFNPINNLFILSGYTPGFVNQNYTSPDGITWTSRPALPLNDIKYDPVTNQMIACYSNLVYTSPDGYTWTLLYTVPTTDFTNIEPLP